MKRIFISLAIVPLFAMAALASETLYIGGGKMDGGYDTTARRIDQKVSNRLPEGWTTVVQNHSGSGALSLAACKATSPYVAPMQHDAMYARDMEGCILKPVAQYSTEPEVGLLLFPPKSKMSDIHDLGPNHTIGVDGIDSGSELTWTTMRGIELGDEGSKDDWANAQPDNYEIEDAHVAASFGDIHAMFLVRKAGSKDFKRLLDLGWSIGKIKDKDINDLEWRGKPLYEVAKVTIRDSSGRKHKNRGVVVPSYIAVNAIAARDRSVLRLIQQASQ